MRKLLLAIILLFPFFLKGQISVFAEYSFDPFKYSIEEENYENYDEELTVIKEFNLGLNFKFSNWITLRLGAARLEKRNASSERYFQDFFIAGSIPQFMNLTLSHSSAIRNYSAFSGIQFDFNRFHIAGHIHLSKGVFKNEAIAAREFTTFTGEVKVTYFELDYENISFLKGDINISYDLLKSKNGTISITAKYIKDYSDDQGFIVKEYTPELREMVENFPGTSFYNFDDFLQGGPLYYDREFWGVGIKMTYNLLHKNEY